MALFCVFQIYAHNSAVSKDRAGLTYAIQKGKSMDVGLVIQRSILNSLKIAKVGLPHPHLITDLCKRAGVQWGESEKLLHPKWTINDKTLDVYKVYASGEGTSGAGSSSAGHVSLAKHKSSQQRMMDMEAQLQYVMEYQQQAVQYQGELAVALMGAITQCANHFQITDPLPVLPPFHPPQQPTTQAEVGQDEDDETEGSETSSTESEDEKDEDMDGGDR